LNAATQPNRESLLATGGSNPLRGTIRVPGDKSISHRAIMLGAIAEGETQVSGFLEGADAISTMNAFRALGVRIKGPEQGQVKVLGLGMRGLTGADHDLDCGNAGTAMRLMMGLLAGQNFSSTLMGDESLSKRPMRRVADPLAMMGAQIVTREGRPPVRILASSGLHGIDYSMPIASAQVKSALLLAGLYAEGFTRIHEPAPTRDHTERMLKGFGVKLDIDGAARSLQGGQKLHACEIDIPADVSSAAFFLVAASIIPGSDLILAHVGMNPTRTGIVQILKLMGARIDLMNPREVGGEPVADLRIRSSQLKGIEVPSSLVPLAIDEFPVLFVAACFAAGRTTVRGAEELRVKESDRIAAMEAGLIACGAKVQATADGMIIEGQPDGSFNSCVIESLGDHRIAMAFAVAGQRSAQHITILDTNNVATSFPGFVELARSCGMQLRQQS